MKKQKAERNKLKNPKGKKFNKGITLIALIITIVVLLILAGVSIATLTGKNGILSRASEAKNKTEEAREKESLELAVVSSQMEDVNTLEITEEKLSNAIKQQFGNNKDFSVTDNEDGSFLVNMNDTKRMYYIDENGEIIVQSKMLKISTADELKAFREDVNSGNTYEGWYIYLTNDITLDINEEWQPIGLYLMENSSTEDETNKPFKGIFDGGGHEVNGIYINTTDKAQGLLGLINNGKVTNVKIGENCNIAGGKATAGVVGYAYNNSIVNNCSNSADINLAFGGGIVGCANVNTSIKNCYNEGEIIGTNEMIGGVAGYVVDGSSIKECYNEGTVIGNKNVGGIVGTVNINSVIDGCYNVVAIKGKSMVGGIVGYIGQNESTKNCYNKGNITGEYYIGGVCGYSGREANINQCYNTGDIEATGKNESGNSNIGGIVGVNEADVINCYNTGAVTGTYECIGGLVGLNRGTLKNSYNTGSIIGTVEKIGGITGNNNEFYYSNNNTTYKGIIYNCYSLERVTEKLIGANNSIIGNECSFKTSLELQEMYSKLGESFKEDKDDINNGYPILQWQ